MAELEREVRELTAQVKNLVVKMGEGGVPAGTQTSGQSWQMLSNGANNLATSVGSAAQGTFNLDKAMDVVTKTLGIFGPAVAGITGVLKTSFDQVKQMNDSMILSGQYGVTFGLNLGKYIETVGQAGISMSDWNRLLASSQKQLQGFGTNAQESANIFLAASAQLRKEPDILRYELMGIEFKHFQNQLVIGADLMKFQALNGDVAQKVLRDAAVNTAIEIDNMARITGRSRQEIQKNIDTANQSQIVELAKMNMSKEELARYQTSMAFMTQYGKDFTATFQELTALRGQVKSTEGKNMLAAIENFAPGMSDLMRRHATSTDENERRNLEREMDFRMSMAAADEKKIEQIKNLYGEQSPVARALLGFTVQAQTMLATGKNALIAGGGTMEGFSYQREEGARLRKEIADAIDKGKTGTLPGGAQISMLLQGLERAVGAGQQATANYIARLVDEGGIAMAKDIDARGALQKILEIQNLKGDDLENLAKKLIGWTGKDLDRDKPKPGETPLPDRYNGSSPETAMYIRGTVTVDAPGKLTGTKDTTGSWFENFGLGSLNILHGREAVVPEGKIGEFINDMLGQSTSTLAGLTGNLRSMPNNTGNDESVQRAIEQITTTISSIPATISSMSSSMNDSGMSSKTTSDVVASLERLNTKLDSLINAVEDSASGTVKAFKQRGNLIA